MFSSFYPVLARTIAVLLLSVNSAFAMGDLTIGRTLMPTGNDQTRTIYFRNLILCRDGDLNRDFKIDLKDLILLQECIKSKNLPKEIHELTYCDINFDREVNWQDVLSWIKCSKGTCVGDVNLDGVFDSTDLILLFGGGGLYESGENACWEQGDWNGDGLFDAADLLYAFQEGCYDDSSNASGPVP